MKRKTYLYTLTLFLFCFPFVASASNVWYQLDDTYQANLRTSTPSPQNPPYWSALNAQFTASTTGISGTAVSVQIQIENDNGYDGLATVGLVECTSASSSTCTTVTTTPTITFPDDAVSHTYTVDFNTPIVLDVSHYYYLIWTGTADGMYAKSDASYNPFFIVSDVPAGISTTQFLYVVPAGGSVSATSSSLSVGYTGYLAPSDFTGNVRVYFNLINAGKNFVTGQCADVICAFSSSYTGYTNYQDISSSGTFTFSTSTDGSSNGVYQIKAIIQQGHFCLFGSCVYYSDLVSTSSSFTLASTSLFDLSQRSTLSFLDGVIGDNATDTEQISADCNPFGGSFNALSCVNSILLLAVFPNQDSMAYLLQTAQSGFLSHWPIGYVTDFVSIISTSTAGTMPVIDATLPMFGNPHIHLDLAHSLDYILNATTSQFNNSSASSTDTFFDITDGYWKIICYILAVVYILKRVFGSHVFSIHKQEKHDN